MTDSMTSRATKEYRNKTEIHHIVPQAAQKALPAQTVMYLVYPEGVETPENKVKLSTILHRGLHTNLYYGIVNYTVVTAYSSANGNKDQEKYNVDMALLVIRSALMLMDNYV